MGQAARRPAQGPGVAFALEDPASLGALAGEWTELAARLDGSSYFQTPDWVLSWWETIAGQPRTQVATWRDASGQLEALVVLSRDRERLHRRLRAAVPVYANAGSGVGAADHCGWLMTPARAPEVDAWLAHAVGRSALLVRNADPDWPSAGLPAGARVVDHTACPRVQLPLTRAGAGPSSTFVRQLHRFTRRLEREGVRFEWAAAERVDERILTALFERHAEGRDRRGTSTFRLDQLDFHRRLVERAGALRGPAAVVARRDERIVGVLYGFWWRDTFAAYQSGWDRAYARHALGNVLVLHALQFAADRRARTFDFLRGTEPYKYRFGAHDRWDRTWLVPGGPAGALLAVRHRLRQRRRSTGRRDRPAAAPRGPG